MRAASSRLILANGVTLAQEGLLTLFPEGYRWLDSLADLPRQVPADAAARGVVLILAPAQARELLRNPPAGKFVVVLWREPADTVSQTLLHHPHVAGVLDDACAPATVYTVLKSALALAEKQTGLNAEQMLDEVLKVGRALASEKDLTALLKLILTHARSLTAADGASIYTFNDAKQLCFRLWQNSSITNEASAAQTLVGDDSIAGYVARSGELLAIADVYALPVGAPYRFNAAFDRESGYRTVSLLTVPLKNKADEVVGILQLINRKTRADASLATPGDFDTYVMPFSRPDQTIAQALAGQAGVALENSLLYRDIERLFDGFIAASVRAIEARDPITAGHSFRVADVCDRLVRALDRCDDARFRSTRFSVAEIRELRYAALLHDFGKVGVKEDVLLKSKKLYPTQLELIRQRFKQLRISLERDAYKALLDACVAEQLSNEALLARRRAAEQALALEYARLDRYWNSISCANEPSVMPLAVSADLDAVAAYRYWDAEEQVQRNLLLPFEFADLSLTKGSLSADERAQIESHVTHTFSFLSAIPWTRDLQRLPDIAFAHHEKLDGSGYPRRLSEPQIPLQSRIMAIADIFDALTAGDRPYKQAVPLARALEILRAEAVGNKVDAGLVKVFIESHAYLADS